MLRSIVNGISDWLHRTVPANSAMAWTFVFGSAVLCVVIFFLMQRLKPRGRKTLIVTVTFVAGLFYALEFFLPTQLVNGQEENALTPLLDIMSDFAAIVGAFTLGLGIYSLAGIHGKTLLRGRSGWFFSLTFFVSMIAMAFVGILAKTAGHENIPINKNLNDILFRGGFTALNGTMFSIVAFYIVSAAYRAFRIRSAEAGLLMGSALIVMLGQVYAGQALTAWLPADGFAANFRIETLSDWLLTRVNAPAVRAVGFGLGVGLLATSLRIWLSLERGSYFDREV